MTAVASEACDSVVVHAEKVAMTRRSLPGLSESEQIASLFKLLGDQRRTRILYALLEAGELCVCDLAAAVEVPEASVSQALRLLRTADVVENRREGRMIYYRLADAHVRLLLDVSRQHMRHGESH